MKDAVKEVATKPGESTTEQQFVVVDGNEAAARVAYALSEVVAIYPITPASPMGELSDAWSSAGHENLWGTVPEVIEMQSEGGAAGAVHGALQAGALTTTFTASQGLLLMLPNMFKIAGELTPAVFHIAARSIATHALSIFGDHSDVMAVRSAGWGMLASASVQECQDMALIAHLATLEARVPFLHFFDGFRTSHEMNKITAVSENDMRALLPAQLVHAHRERALSPDRPVLRGSAQNPDVFFQAREACNPFYNETPAVVEKAMARFADVTGRRYRLFDYVGADDAERVLVLMGSGCGAVEEAVETLVARGEKVGAVKVRLFRPFDTASLMAALPATARSIAVLDRTKEPGCVGEPLYQDIVTALAEHRGDSSQAPPRVIGGRYGLSSKEFTPAMAAAVLSELAKESPKQHFTVGIVDDVTHLSLKAQENFDTEEPDVTRAMFFGLGSDGTVGANKNSVKIVGQETPLYAQGHFVYDSKKAGAVTVSHLRFSPRPIRSTYQIDQADFVACHQFEFLHKMDLLTGARVGATFLLNSPFGPQDVWEKMPLEVQDQILQKKLKVYVIDAHAVATEAGMGNRINTVMQTAFFAISGILPRAEAIARIKDAIAKTYGRRGQTVLERNNAAVDGAVDALHELEIPTGRSGGLRQFPPVPEAAPDFVQRVTSLMIQGKGDLLPVSALPVDGTFPVGTAKWEKRSIAREIPIWDPEICIQCALCSLVCPHAAIRTNVFEPAALRDSPEGFLSMPWKGKDLPDHLLTIQVAPDDCTGCGVCVDVCPARSKEMASHKAINMEPKGDHLETERRRFDFFDTIAFKPRASVDTSTVKGSQMCEPLFEYSGACAGCGETPYLKLLTQMFGDRMMVANATGCSSIYGGNLPTTPWSKGADGRGPAWSNSLFEDNAEFGLGMRLAVDAQAEFARELVARLAPVIGEKLADDLIEAEQKDEAGIAAQRERVAELKKVLQGIEHDDAQDLLQVAETLVRRSVWLVGGDGWAYDIGFGGLDHVLASGRDVNALVLDTEVYSNTGGQASKATPKGAVAKFATGGKTLGKKDLGMIAMAYGNVYVAQIAVGANPKQTARVLADAENYRGPSLIIAYSHCIAHGIDMSTSMTHQKDAVKSGYLNLYHYDPRRGGTGGKPLVLDSGKPKLPFKDFAMKEARFAMLARSAPEQSSKLLSEAQQEIHERWHFYEQMAGVERGPAKEDEEGSQ